MVGVLLITMTLRRALVAPADIAAPAGETVAPPPSDGDVTGWGAALVDAGLDGEPRLWAGLGVVVAGGAAAVGATAGPVAAIVLPVGAVASGAVALRMAAGRGARRADAALPELLEHAARALRAGFDLAPALDRAAATVGGPHGRQVRAAVRRMGAGAPFPDAVAPWIEAQPRRPVRSAVAALEVAIGSGGARARALDGVAASIRSQAALDAEILALASQTRASAAVLVTLPLVFGVVGSLADPRLAHTLLATGPGLACLVGATVLDLIGAWWMQRIVGGGSGL
jgi:tight adherence protein B